MRDHSAGSGKREVGDQPALLVEDERADWNVELEVGPGAPGLASAGTVGSWFCLPLRSLLVER